MMRWVQAIWHRFEKIIRYLFCSIISTVFDVAIVWCLYHLAGVSLVVANTVGVVAGFLISYVLSALSLIHIYQWLGRWFFRCCQW